MLSALLKRIVTLKPSIPVSILFICICVVTVFVQIVCKYKRKNIEVKTNKLCDSGVLYKKEVKPVYNFSLVALTSGFYPECKKMRVGIWFKIHIISCLCSIDLFVSNRQFRHWKSTLCLCSIGIFAYHRHNWCMYNSEKSQKFSKERCVFKILNFEVWCGSYLNYYPHTWILMITKD